MTVSVDASAIASGGARTSISLSHTSASSTTLGIVRLSLLDGVNPVVTWGGVAMTQSASVDVGGRGHVSLFYIASPAVGVQTVSASWSTSSTVVMSSLSITGASTAMNSAVTATGTSITPSTTVPSAAGALVVDAISTTSTGSAPTISVGGGQTAVTSTAVYGSGGNYTLAGHSYEAGAASVVMSWTLSGSLAWAAIGLNISVANASETPTAASAGSKTILAGQTTQAAVNSSVVTMHTSKGQYVFSVATGDKTLADTSDILVDETADPIVDETADTILVYLYQYIKNVAMKTSKDDYVMTTRK